MTGIDYFVDTNCFVYLPDKNPIIQPFLNSNQTFSYITETELLIKKGLPSKEDDLIRSMLRACMKINQQQEISDAAIKLRRKYSVKVTDAIIAASALFTHIPILTADKGFSKINEIDCLLLEV